MANKWMYIVIMIYKIAPSVEYTYWFGRLDTNPNKPTNQNLIKVPKEV